MRPRDTSEDAWRIQMEIHRRMTPDQKIRVVSEMSELMVSLFKAGIRHRHPEYSGEEVRLAAIRHLLGPDLFRAAYPGSPECEI